MSGKNQAPFAFNWQASDPRTGFLPLNLNTQGKGSVPSGVVSGTMSGTNTIYSQIVDVSRMDDVAIEFNWTGTPTGTISLLVSNSAINWPSISATAFTPAFVQPSGTAAFEGMNLSLLGFKYILLQYTNASGAGVLTAYGQVKDLN